MMYLDLAELDEVFKGKWLWSSDRFNVACFNRAYHLGDPSVPLDQAVRDVVSERTGRRQEGPIRMLTQLRYFGHNFNPVSFYYCFGREKNNVETIIVEIHNTPWGERFCYVLEEKQNEGSEKDKRFALSKQFHVSPFMDMEINYTWEFSVPENSVHVFMTSAEKGEKFFEAELSMDRREITGPELSRMLIKYPFMNIKIIGAIYWQAFRLWTKGAPFYIHPAKRKDEKESQIK
jgi:DUF1365 family protein